jgi:hypothetical protein
MLLSFGIAVLIVGLIAIALYSASRGSGQKVTESDVGGINAFDAYYGKDAHRYGGVKPCEACVTKGCIGAGQCRCQCHAAAAA